MKNSELQNSFARLAIFLASTVLYIFLFIPKAISADHAPLNHQDSISKVSFT